MQERDVQCKDLSLSIWRQRATHLKAAPNAIV